MLLFILVTIVAVVASVLFHLASAETLISRWRRYKKLRRWRLAILIVAFIFVHLIEAAIFAVVLGILLNNGNYGTLEGVELESFGSLFYYSAITYTTVGYGDITPVGGIRIFAAVEALVGMVLVAWTASVIFTVMQRTWRSDSEQEDALEPESAG
jgi:hypothetical protein